MFSDYFILNWAFVQCAILLIFVRFHFVFPAYLFESAVADTDFLF